ncbi:MAG TPA: 1,4-alpha-glucan branching protein domain-containing protein [Tepidisphaeraceae bacterium]|jgi:1,4-alpha-glucan branching enzyme
MSEPLGALCFVLHGHLPYVLHHGSYPHGEAWLYEAAAETYLPLLDMIGECALNNARPAFTIGLTPILLEQLSHPRFKTGFVEYLNERAQRAQSDKATFEKERSPHQAFLAQRWTDWYNHKLECFNRINQDIPGEFAKRFREGHIQILTSNATHAYMPLLLNDEMIRAQLAAGTSVSEKRLGIKPRGMWLPECAYRPSWGHWMPAVLFDNARNRSGLENFIADAGITHFFVDSHLVGNGHPLGTCDQGNFKTINETQLHWDSRRGWRDPLQPVGVVSHPECPRVHALARHPRVSEQVWSGSIGYPGAGQYLEFHRKHGDRGLRYHKVTHNKAPLSNKDLYYPDDISAKVYEHSQHFCNVVRDVLREFKFRTGRQGVCIAPFDAELFGHWWFEGPQFLRDVMLTLNSDPEIKLLTTEEALYHFPPDKVMRLPEGSWGENGNHSVWINDRNRWMWEIEYRAEGTFLRNLHGLPWRENEKVRAVLIKAARELLLLQASDWPFVVHTHGAVDYGIQRFSGHATRFDRMNVIAEKIAAGGELTDVEKVEIQETDLHDSVFPDIDLNWWV